MLSKVPGRPLLPLLPSSLPGELTETRQSPQLLAETLQGNFQVKVSMLGGHSPGCHRRNSDDSTNQTAVPSVSAQQVQMWTVKLPGPRASLPLVHPLNSPLTTIGWLPIRAQNSLQSDPNLSWHIELTSIPSNTRLLGLLAFEHAVLFSLNSLPFDQCLLNRQHWIQTATPVLPARGSCCTPFMLLVHL